ncbi:MAG TPA: leucine-rich repeat domain-containing protein [Candidatus Limnocylindrales bacterium]|nr:leucine-rich repeat domain-containing protein [Candidatus Limnocylindrales bacterium]
MRFKRECFAIILMTLAAELAGNSLSRAQGIFPDPQLDAAVSSTLGKAPGTVTLNDLALLTCLSACNRQITNLAGLDQATNLLALFVSGNSIQDLKPIAALLQLTSLDAGQNAIQNLGPLVNLTNLTCLSLSENPATNYWVISNLTHLSTLTIRGGNLKNLDLLRPLSSLSFLTLWRNGITDTSPLAELTNLITADLRWNNIGQATNNLAWPPNLVNLYLGANTLSNAPLLLNLRNLTLLNLDDNCLRNLFPLTDLTNLTYLAASRNPITNYSTLTNLTSLASLELRGNNLTNLSFLSTAIGLFYLDLTYNQLSDTAGLPALTNLQSLVLAGNPLINYAALAGMQQVTNLWLFENKISNAVVVTNLTRLAYLNLERNRITSLAPLLTLTNLTGLALSRNSVTDYSGLTGLTNLSNLRLDASRLVDLNLLTNLVDLAFLSLDRNQIVDLSPLTNFLQLRDLYLQRNCISSLQPLLSLPQLANVDISRNFLDLRPGTTTSLLIQTLQSQRTGILPCGCTVSNADWTQPCQGVRVAYLPTNQPPNLSVLPKWFIPCNTNSELAMTVTEYPLPEEPLTVTAITTNSDLIAVSPGALAGTNETRILEVLAGCNVVSNAAWVTLNAVDDVGLSANAVVRVTVVPNLIVTNLCAAINQDLLSALSTSTQKPTELLSVVDLLNLTNLDLGNASLDTSCVIHWLTNLTHLGLAGSHSNLDFITNLAQLTDVTLDNTVVQDLFPLVQLPFLTQLRIISGHATNLSIVITQLGQLVTLDLTGNSISNLDFLGNLTQLQSLNLDNNRVTDLSALSSLTNLQSLFLQQNFLVDIGPLTNLSHLSALDLRLNLLALDSSSTALGILNTLTYNGANVLYWPQRAPPTILLPTVCFVQTNLISTISFTVFDNSFYPPSFLVHAFSQDPNLLPNENLAVASTNNRDWFLSLTPAPDSEGLAPITLSATNDAGLGSTAVLRVNVVVPVPVSVPDPNLLSALSVAWGKSPATVNSVDFLGSTSLNLANAGISNLTGLSSATNMTSLYLDNNNIVDLSPLAMLNQLSWLSASNNLITDASPLQQLPQLQFLNLSLNPITNYDVFLTGFTQLSSLYLAGNAMRSLTFLTNLSQLTVLSLATNLIWDLPPLGSLTNLNVLLLGQNLLTNISPLQTLLAIGALDLTLNQLDLSTGSGALATIGAFQTRGSSVLYLPQLPLDSDGDGMPDAWEIAHGLNPYDSRDALQDSDGDSCPNLLEYMLGTDPQNPADGSANFVSFAVMEAGVNHLWLQFRRPHAPVHPQCIPEVSGDRLTWYSDPQHVQQVSIVPLDSDFDIMTVKDTTPIGLSHPRFFRLRVTQNLQ